MIGSTLLNYTIVEKLGAGGQGTVYRATDEKLGRTVVIKVLSPELTSREANLKRFEREARLASSLDHPNICTIYGLHEVDGVHFIAMQYIEGRNVRQLVGGRPLELQSALSIAVQVADALAAAHARGIIHRDIKAGNVMVTDRGLVKVLDFGLAKLLDESDGTGEHKGDIHLTEMGVPYGTATYAAPEQASGQRVDHRADIFSTGVLIYEMLTGTWPFQGKTSVEVRYAVMYDTPQRIAQVRADAPARLQEILDRAMAKNPDQRYQRIDDFRDDLRAVLREALTTMGGFDDTSDIPGAAVPVVPRHQKGSGRGFGRTVRRWLRGLSGAEPTPTSSFPPSPQTTRPTTGAAWQQPFHETSQGGGDGGGDGGGAIQKSIAILPFRNLSNDPDASFYEFSLADAVITELARLRSLVVRPSSLIVKYQGQAVDPIQAGRDLSVSAVLSSSFLRVGERLRVTTQLLDVQSGAILWSDRIDASAQDIIALQDNIASRIADGLSVEQAQDEKPVAASPATTNAEAYEEYLRGRDCHGKFVYHTLSREDSDSAIKHFERAVQLDPKFALAHCALGGAHANRVIKGFGGTEDYEIAEDEFNTALKLDPQLLEARMHMVFIFLSRGEKDKARAEIERLRKEAPNDVGVHFIRGTLHRLDGEYDKALAEFGRMLRLNPAERVVVSYNRARIFRYQGRYDDALLELDQGAALEPDHPLIKTFRAMVYYLRGNSDAAVELLRDVLDKHPQMDGIRPLLAICLTATGERDAARAQLTERVKESASADHDIAYWLASAYALLEERDEAFEWLERAISLGNENRPWFETDPSWEKLRDDPRFQSLMDRIEKQQQRERSNTS